VDLHIGTIGINSAALEVACGPPAIGANFEIVFFTENAWMELKSSANES
jgi:hypothetical protein